MKVTIEIDKTVAGLLQVLDDTGKGVRPKTAHC